MGEKINQQVAINYLQWYKIKKLSRIQESLSSTERIFIDRVFRFFQYNSFQLPWLWQNPAPPR